MAESHVIADIVTELTNTKIARTIYVHLPVAILSLQYPGYASNPYWDENPPGKFQQSGKCCKPYT